MTGGDRYYEALKGMDDVKSLNLSERQLELLRRLFNLEKPEKSDFDFDEMQTVFFLVQLLVQNIKFEGKLGILRHLAKSYINLSRCVQIEARKHVGEKLKQAYGLKKSTFLA